tara:strand:- start:2852 stop:3382 length:531 start_codon:yes stop_codon:yes gene_type:complete
VVARALILFYVTVILAAVVNSKANAADTNTVSSTVVTDKTPPTASAPSVVINNTDVCKSAKSAAVQTQIFGFASGITVTDDTCELLKLSRSLYGMGMKVAGVSLLCTDNRVFDAMWMAGTPCPYKGKIGNEARLSWEANPQDAPEGNTVLVIAEEKSDYTINEEDDTFSNDIYPDG